MWSWINFIPKMYRHLNNLGFISRIKQIDNISVNFKCKTCHMFWTPCQAVIKLNFFWQNFLHKKTIKKFKFNFYVFLHFSLKLLLSTINNRSPCKVASNLGPLSETPNQTILTLFSLFSPTDHKQPCVLWIHFQKLNKEYFEIISDFR